MGLGLAQTRFFSLHLERKRTSAAKAVKRQVIYGTAEAVPFVGQSLQFPLRVSEGFMCCQRLAEVSRERNDKSLCLCNIEG
jgi:hypothetical protein